MQLRPIKQRFNWPSREVTLEDLHPQHQQSCTTYDQKEVQDDVIEINLEAEAEPRPTYVSKNLSSEMAKAIVNLLCKNTKTALLGSIKKCLALIGIWSSTSYRSSKASNLTSNRPA